MANLFCLWFDEYLFDPQLPIEIEFNDTLPFDVLDGRDLNGNYRLFVSEFKYDPEKHPPEYQHLVKDNLYITKVNGMNIYQTKMSPDNTLSPNDTSEKKEEITRITPDDFASTYEDFPLTIEFWEDIGFEDQSKPLGLEYVEDNETGDDEKSSNSPKNIEVVNGNNKSRVNSLMSLKTERIHEFDIGASSYQEGFEPFNCRLNHPTSCWKPSEQDQKTLDTWIRVDLRKQRNVTKIRIQGYEEKVSKNKKVFHYVTSLWIDYSNDCCTWESHKLGEINLSSFDNEILIWPAIQSRFIRLRPVSYIHSIALRFELYGYEKESSLSPARYIKFNNVTGSARKKLLEQTENLNLSPDSMVWQIDCQSLIKLALEKRRMKLVGFIDCTDKSIHGADSVQHMCIFCAPNARESENLLNALAEIGVGATFGLLAMTPVSYRKPQVDRFLSTEDPSDQFSFASTVSATIMLDQLVERVKGGAQLNFDFIVMLIAAALIAAGGLVTDSSVVVVASMLVSPLMGPVLSFTFGASIANYEMRKTGLINECFCLLTCVVVGFLFGLPYFGGKSDLRDWPTEQMSSRGTANGLIDGVLIAIPSGIGVALSILSDYMSAAVGVAISASLLPPAVNTGMLLALTLFKEFGREKLFQDKNDENDYPHKYMELLEMGMYSFILVLENIILIFITALLMFKIKDVTAQRSILGKNNKQWDQLVTLKSLMKNTKTNYNSLIHLTNSRATYYGGGGSNTQYNTRNSTNNISGSPLPSSNSTLTRVSKLGFLNLFKDNNEDFSGKVLTLNKQVSRQFDNHDTLVRKHPRFVKTPTFTSKRLDFKDILNDGKDNNSSYNKLTTIESGDNILDKKPTEKSKSNSVNDETPFLNGNKNDDIEMQNVNDNNLPNNNPKPKNRVDSISKTNTVTTTNKNEHIRRQSTHDESSFNPEDSNFRNVTFHNLGALFDDNTKPNEINSTTNTPKKEINLDNTKNDEKKDENEKNDKNDKNKSSSNVLAQVIDKPITDKPTTDDKSEHTHFNNLSQLFDN